MNAATPRVQFLFDFGSPNAYLSHQVLPGIEARTGVRFEYVPILLGGLFKLANNRSPVVAYAEIPNKLAYEHLEMRRFIARHRIDRFRLNPFFPVNTLKIMRLAVAAQALGCAPALVDAVFAAMWEQGRNMDDEAEIAAVLGAAGLDAAALVAKSQEPELKARLAASTQSAYERGAFGAPTFFVGDEIYFGKERLADVEEQILRARA
ncbi:2-hydroxychromene-2-carboxylate isomerase [Rivibacter subsaxonicus]|uniref:2-hydroxychromene-2-carboxylate isomerase n=1 Tax=Rivibacter subsaxonicus TaxID=457575 RepID=A0A4Q7W150_9BURK|nr:2-hydroxychromene-2-carboxylate isomerase [Rivibacter subsaxonicus]RZU02249.1 2-hydroxychromene-2-carboxylate isomerase [Rivibacter subsaxonicus]